MGGHLHFVFWIVLVQYTFNGIVTESEANTCISYCFDCAYGFFIRLCKFLWHVSDGLLFIRLLVWVVQHLGGFWFDEIDYCILGPFDEVD